MNDKHTLFTILLLLVVLFPLCGFCPSCNPNNIDCETCDIIEVIPPHQKKIKPYGLRDEDLSYQVTSDSAPENWQLN